MTYFLKILQNKNPIYVAKYMIHSLYNFTLECICIFKMLHRIQ